MSASRLNEAYPEPGSSGELADFARLQRRLQPLFDRVFADRLAPRTIVVVPGLSLDAELLARLEGFTHYEERQLTMLMLLKMPNTRMVLELPRFRGQVAVLVSASHLLDAHRSYQQCSLPTQAAEGEHFSGAEKNRPHRKPRERRSHRYPLPWYAPKSSC